MAQRASFAPALGLNTIIFKHVYWYMQQTQVSAYRTIGPLVLSVMINRNILGETIAVTIANLFTQPITLTFFFFFVVVFAFGVFLGVLYFYQETFPTR